MCQCCLDGVMGIGFCAQSLQSIVPRQFLLSDLIDTGLLVSNLDCKSQSDAAFNEQAPVLLLTRLLLRSIWLSDWQAYGGANRTPVGNTVDKTVSKLSSQKSQNL